MEVIMNARIEDYAYAENREITEVQIPDGTEQIGRHAFYNCRSLRTVHLPHGGIEIEDGAFKNCRNLTHIILHHGEGDCTCLKDILYDMYQEVTVSIFYDSGGQALLLFPRYEYEYIANEPARIFQEIGYGAGYLYQQCFFDSQVDFRRYDDLWRRACVSEEIPVLGRILSYRLRFPWQLSDTAHNSYQHYWQEHQEELLTYYMKEQDMDSLRFFLEQEKAGSGLLSLAVRTAQTLEKPGIVSYLLDLQRRTNPLPGSTGKFDL